MTKEEFHRWKADGREVFHVIKSKVNEIEYAVAREAGIDPAGDRFKAGMIKGIEMVLELDWEDTEDDQDQGS